MSKKYWLSTFLIVTHKTLRNFEHRGEAALRKQLQAKNITVKETFWEKVSENPRDAMVQKLVRKVESLKKPK